MNLVKLLAPPGAMALLLSACCPMGVEFEHEVNNTDWNFMTMAAYHNLNEQDAGRLATAQGSSAAVQDYGNRMEADYSTAHAKLQAAVSGTGAALPTTPDTGYLAAREQLSATRGMPSTPPGYTGACVAARPL